MLLTEKPIREKYEERVWSNNPTKMYTYYKIKKGDKILVEVYKTSKGEYKISPEGNPVDFLLYCVAIPVGIFLVVIMAHELVNDDRKKKSENEITSKQ